MTQDDEDDEPNAALFRECLFDVVLAHLSPAQKRKKPRNRAGAREGQDSNSNTIPQTDSSSLAEFSDHLAGEIFPTLPPDLRHISHRSLQDNPSLSDKWSLPLSLSTYEEIAFHLPPSVTDSLEAYGLINPPSTDAQSFLSPAVAAFISAATTPPPKWIVTRAEACEICDRDWIPLTYHHLIPRAVHAKALKRGWHEEGMLNSVAWLCRACHTFVHRMASNEELAREWWSVERILEREDVARWAGWVGRVRWKKT